MYVPPQALNCESDSCSEAGCGVDLTGAARYVHVLNLDCLRQTTRRSGRIADCAILWKERGVFAIVELKGGQDTIIDRLVEQIQEGVNSIDSLTEEQHLEDFYPILMYKGRDPTAALRGKIVEIQGIKRRVIPLECGSRLSAIPGLRSLRRRTT